MTDNTNHENLRVLRAFVVQNHSALRTPHSALRNGISARGLSKSYGVQWAVREVDLDVAAGEVVAIFGANGAGKSTLIRLLATLTSPSLGTLHIAGHDASRHTRLVRGAIGALGHQNYLYSELTAVENLRLYAALYELADAHQAVYEALDNVGLTDVGAKRVRDFSRGMQQRLALARATLHRPAVLLLDEPDSGLDANGINRLERLVHTGRSLGQSIVITTHELELGLALAQKAVILERGRLAYSAPTGAHSGEQWRNLYHKIAVHNS